MFAPAFVGSDHRVDVRSVAEMRRALIPFEDQAARMKASRAAILSVIADAKRGDAAALTPESIARALFLRFKREGAAARKV